MNYAVEFISQLPPSVHAFLLYPCAVPYQRISRFLKQNFPFTRSWVIQTVHQVHSDAVVITGQNQYSEADAMITNQSNHLLCVQVADCAAVLCYDAGRKLIAAIHAGWRGLQKEIVRKTVKKMIEDFGSNPLEFFVYVSPCIAECCYEVGKEVACLFPNTSVEYRGNTWYLSLRREILRQLTTMRVVREQIFIDPRCTKETAYLPSYRREKEQAARILCLIGMKNTQHSQ